MTITAIKQQLKDNQRVSIFVDGKYSFSLSLDELLQQKVTQGKELSQAELKKLTKISEDGKTRARALAWVLNRPHSIKEFKDYMIIKKAEQELTETLIEEFTAKGYLDDVRYAGWLIELRFRTNRSNRAIYAELVSKGVSREVIGEILSDNKDETRRLQTLVAKKQKLAKYKHDEPKLIKYLTSKGFSYSMVRELLSSKK